VLARGSQYRVESMMCRLAHSQNYLLLAASKEQVTSLPRMYQSITDRGQVRDNI
jgi:DNA polymerase zeta